MVRRGGGGVHFCNRLSEEEGLAPYYGLSQVQRWPDGSVKSATVETVDSEGYRLPTEAEWEYSCLAGSDGSYCFGSNAEQLDEYAWFAVNASATSQPVGSLAPNAFGLFDMHGNVWEWCWDWHLIEPDATMTIDPTGPKQGDSRSCRGGSWFFFDDFARADYRGRSFPMNRDSNTGFRVVRTLQTQGPQPEEGR